MGKSLIRIVETIKEELSGFHITDDFKLDDEYIKDKCHDARATLIRQELKRGYINRDYYQELCCIEVTCEAKSCTIGDITVASGTVIWKSEIESLMLGVGDKNILMLGNDNMLTGYGDDNVFHRTTTNNFMAFRGQRAMTDKKSWTGLGSTQYYKNLPQDTRFVCGIVLLYDPTNACNWDDDSVDYPVPSETSLQIMVLKSIAGSLGIPNDEAQDSRSMPLDGNSANELNKNTNDQQRQIRE